MRIVVADQFVRRAGHMLTAWISAMHRFAWTVTIAALASAALAGWYFVGHVAINTDTSDMISPELEFRRLSEEISQAFPEESDNLVVVVDALTRDRADDAARLLAARLREQPKLFGVVYDPAGESFFRRNGLLYLDLGELQDLSDRLAAAQPFLGALWRDPSLRGLFEMLRLAAEESLKGSAGQPMDLAPALTAIAAVVEAHGRGQPGELSWHSLMSGQAEKAKDKRRILVLKPALNWGSLEPAAKATAELRRIATELGLTPDKGFRVRLTGSVAINQEEFMTVEQGMGLAAVGSFAMVVVILAVGLGSAWITLACIVTLVVGLLWTAALAILMVGTLNLISVAFLVLFIGLGIEFGIHYGLFYRDQALNGAPRGRALENAGRDLGGALFLCAAATGGAFYAFAPTDYVGLAQLGLISGTGMFVALFANFTVLPALLALMPAPRSGHRGAERSIKSRSKLLSGLSQFASRRAGTVTVVTAALVASALVAATAARFDFDPLNLKDPGTESVQTLRDLMADGQAGRYSATVLAKDLRAAQQIAARMESLPEVDEAKTLASLVPKDQPEKLALIGDMSLFLAPSLSGAAREAAPSQAQQMMALDRLEAALARLAAVQDDPAQSAAARLLDALRQYVPRSPQTGQLDELEKRLLVALPGRLQALRESLEAGPVSIQNLPSDLVRRFLARDGRARIDIEPKDDLTDREALVRFVAAIRTVAPEATGTPVNLLESGNAIVRAFVEATVIAYVAALVIVVLVLRSIRDSLLAIAPASLAGVVTPAFSALFDFPFNYANVIVLPLVFGMSIDFGIHLVNKARRAGNLRDALMSSTPRGMLLAALTNVASFASIALSSHVGTASMGILLVVAVGVALFCSLIILPSLMTVFWRPSPRA